MSVKAELNVDMINSKNLKPIEAIISEFDGVKNFDIEQESNKVTITYDVRQVNLVDLKQAMMVEGYTVIEI